MLKFNNKDLNRMLQKVFLILGLSLFTFFSVASQELSLNMNIDEAKAVFKSISLSRKLENIEGIWLLNDKTRLTFSGSEPGTWGNKDYQIAIIKKFSRYVCYFFSGIYINTQWDDLTFNDSAGENIYMYRYDSDEKLGCWPITKAIKIVNNSFETEMSTNCDPRNLKSPHTLEVKMFFQKLFPE